jgi:hypothetical protein
LQLPAQQSLSLLHEPPEYAQYASLVRGVLTSFDALAAGDLSAAALSA